MNPEILRVRSSDGAETDATVYAAAYAQAPVVLIWSAMGVSARFYQPLAEKIAGSGLNAVTVDLRGIGSSSLRARRGTDFGYATLVEKDWPAAVAAVRARFPQSPLWLLGHSLGGQLSALYLAQNPGTANGLLLVASGSVYYKGWNGTTRWGTLFFTQFAAGLATLLGYFPGKRVGFGGTEAKTVMRDWARVARNGRYQPTGTGFDYEAALSRMSLPVFGITLTRDNFASRQAMHNLLAKMPAAKTEHRHLRAEDTGGIGLDHFNWVKNADAIVPLLSSRVRPPV